MNSKGAIEGHITIIYYPDYTQVNRWSFRHFESVLVLERKDRVTYTDGDRLEQCFGRIRSVFPVCS